jgi:hypothetical protein
MIKACNVNPVGMIQMYAGTGGIAKGQLGMVSSDTVIDATEGQTTAVLVGIAADDYDAGEVAVLYPLDCELEMDIYQGGATDVFADSDIGADFDLEVSSTIHYIDPNDTTNGMFVLMRYDNTSRKAWARVINALRYI